ncbi:MAG: hypothetical protein KDJ38_01700 [Gammaproteobacteria bacterium]|nr:hypothetical protein [Gammaproteobacteria bacterium]
MVKPVTGIFAPAGDSQAQKLFASLEELQPGAAGLYYFPEDGNPPVCLGRDEILWNGFDVSRLKTAFVRAYNYSNPVVPPVMEDTDWSLWQFDYMCEQQKTSFLYSALAEMQRRGVVMSNAPGVYLDVSMKADLLERIRAAGVSVPDLICTNNRSEADAFADAREHILWRPVTGRAAWQLCLEKQLDALVDTDKTPVLLAGLESGHFLRCYISDGEPVLCLKFAPPAQTPLERLEVFEVAEENDFYPQLKAAAAVSNMRWGAVHCVLEDGRISVYDVDPDPVLRHLPPDVQDYLTLCLAHGLLGRSVPAADALMQTPLARSLPFLRRMLTVLFDLERSKYAQAASSE